MGGGGGWRGAWRGRGESEDNDERGGKKKDDGAFLFARRPPRASARALAAFLLSLPLSLPNAPSPFLPISSRPDTEETARRPATAAMANFIVGWRVGGGWAEDGGGEGNGGKKSVSEGAPVEFLWRTCARPRARGKGNRAAIRASRRANDPEPPLEGMAGRGQPGLRRARPRDAAFLGRAKSLAEAVGSARAACSSGGRVAAGAPPPFLHSLPAHAARAMLRASSGGSGSSPAAAFRVFRGTYLWCLGGGGRDCGVWQRWCGFFLFRLPPAPRLFSHSLEKKGGGDRGTPRHFSPPAQRVCARVHSYTCVLYLGLGRHSQKKKIILA